MGVGFLSSQNGMNCTKISQIGLRFKANPKFCNTYRTGCLLCLINESSPAKDLSANCRQRESILMNFDDPQGQLLFRPSPELAPFLLNKTLRYCFVYKQDLGRVELR